MGQETYESNQTGFHESRAHSFPRVVFRIKEKRENLKFISFSSMLLLNVAAAAAKSLQSCQTVCDPTDGSPPGSLSLGFSSQEHWSGLPFPSPMHESEK